MPISPSYSSSFFLFCGSTALTEQVLLLETVKRFLKYPYPGLQSFKTPFCKASTRYRPKKLLFHQEAIEAWANTYCQNCHSSKDTMLITT